MRKIKRYKALENNIEKLSEYRARIVQKSREINEGFFGYEVKVHSFLSFKIDFFVIEDNVSCRLDSYSGIQTPYDEIVDCCEASLSFNLQDKEYTLASFIEDDISKIEAEGLSTMGLIRVLDSIDSFLEEN